VNALSLQIHHTFKTHPEQRMNPNHDFARLALTVILVKEFSETSLEKSTATIGVRAGGGKIKTAMV